VSGNEESGWRLGVRDSRLRQYSAVISPRNPSLLETHVGSGADTNRVHVQLVDVSSKFLWLFGRDLHLGMVDLDFCPLTPYFRWNARGRC
jgi:hypothetical protein